MTYAHCWEERNCPPRRRDTCPAYPSGGKKCWMVTGTMCRGEQQGSMREKIARCRECSWYKALGGVPQ